MMPEKNGVGPSTQSDDFARQLSDKQISDEKCNEYDPTRTEEEKFESDLAKAEECDAAIQNESWFKQAIGTVKNLDNSWTVWTVRMSLSSWKSSRFFVS